MTFRRSIPALASVLAAACATSGGPRPDEAGARGSFPALEKVCAAAPCSGKLARVIVLRREGRIVRYLHHADPTSCADGPSVYFDQDGKQVGGIGMFPVVRGSPEEQRLAEQRAALEAGGAPSEEVDCKGRILRTPQR
jgi:hypothetical protein